MRYVVLSDVHASLEALEAVLKDLQKQEIKEILFLGDAVGYGPDPNECLELLKEKCRTLLAGNHDWAAIGLTSIMYFNEYAQHAIKWTMGIITEENKKVLNLLPIKQESRDEDFTLVHSTPKDPEEWHYLLTLWDAEINFNYFDTKFCFLGHSHQPFIIEQVPSGELLTYNNSARIKKNSRYIINVGSVGQPRDGDPRACYAIVDDEKIEIIRVPYDIIGVQNKMRKENLPYTLIERLSIGR